MTPALPEFAPKSGDEARGADVKTAVRTLRLFEVYAKTQRPLVLSELAELLDMPASSCLLLVRTLLQRGYLYETGRRAGYYPTRRLFDHASAIVAHDPVVERLRGALEALRDHTSETITLSKIQGDRLVYLLVADSPQIVRPAIQAGVLRPLHSTATGKALLAQLDPVTRARLLKTAGMPRLTAATRTSLRRVEADIEAGKARGWYGNEGESVADLNAVALALQLNHEAYAITVMGPAYRLDRAAMSRHARALQATVARVSAA